jgi:hypothetical protein
MKFRLLTTVLCGLLAHPALASPVLRWTPAASTIELAEQTTLSIMLDDTLSVRTIELYISYNSDVVSTVSGGPGDLFAGYNLFSGFEEVAPATPGQWHGYCVILGAGDWTVGPGELFSWTVQGDLAGVSALVSVSVKLLPPGGGEYETTSLPGATITVGGVSAVGDELATAPSLSLFPNPFNPRTQVVFGGSSEQAGRLDVWDLRGRKVVTLWQGVLPSGQSIPWDGRDAAGRDAPSGVYSFVLTRSGGERLITRGTLLR